MLIELCGTPLSGKSSVVEALRRTGNYTPFRRVEESFRRCPFDDRDFELGVLWTIFDTYLNADWHPCQNSGVHHGLTVFDRGIFDRIAFCRLLGLEDARYAALVQGAEQWLRSSKQLPCIDMIFIFLTSYENSRERKMKFRLRPDSRFRVVNPVVIGRLNTIYLELFAELKNELPLILIDDGNGSLSVEQKASFVAAHLDRSCQRVPRPGHTPVRS